MNNSDQSNPTIWWMTLDCWSCSMGKNPYFLKFKFTFFTTYPMLTPPLSSWDNIKISETFSEPSQTSKTELFAKIINNWKPLTIFTKSSILDVRLGSEYASELNWLNWISLSILGNRYLSSYTLLILSSTWIYKYKWSVCSWAHKVHPQLNFVFMKTIFFEGS